MLLKGHTVAYRSSGNSLQPMVASGDRCVYTPVKLDSEVAVRDVVFCEVQDGDRFYAHLVSKKEWNQWDECFYFWISNLKGRTNGWCHIKHIYGKLIDVEA